LLRNKWSAFTGIINNERGRRSEIGSQRSEKGDRRSLVPGGRSDNWGDRLSREREAITGEVGGQRSEVGDRKSVNS
jgi:hypothetical protein